MVGVDSHLGQMDVPRLNVRKRTKALDAAQTVILHSDGTDAGTVHSTVGEFNMSPLDNEQLADNLRRSRLEGAITQLVEAVYAQAADFFQRTILGMMSKMAPLRLDLVQRGHNDVADAFMAESGIECGMDGLVAFVKCNGEVLATCEPDIEPAFKDAVARRIASCRTIMLAGEKGQAA